MKEYCVEYEIKGKGFLVVKANSEEEAMSEIESIFMKDSPKIEDNQWIDEDVVWDLEWDTETVDATEEK